MKRWSTSLVIRGLQTTYNKIPLHTWVTIRKDRYQQVLTRMWETGTLTQWWTKKWLLWFEYGLSPPKLMLRFSPPRGTVGRWEWDLVGGIWLLGAESPSINECLSHVSSPSHRTGLITVSTSCYKAKLLFVISLFHMDLNNPPFFTMSWSSIELLWA